MVKTGQRKEKGARKRKARGRKGERERKKRGERTKVKNQFLNFFNSIKSTFIRIQIMLK